MDKDLNVVKIYTDGACSGNPGPGSWAAIVIDGKKRKEIVGKKKNTTNNRMELLAVIKALEYVVKKEYKNSSIKLYSDSKYVVQGVTRWIKNWKRYNWKKSNNKMVLNKDLWVKIDLLSSELNVDWKWVKGHNGNPLNEYCDKLAKEQINLN